MLINFEGSVKCFVGENTIVLFVSTLRKTNRAVPAWRETWISTLCSFSRHIAGDTCRARKTRGYSLAKNEIPGDRRAMFSLIVSVIKSVLKPPYGNREYPFLSSDDWRWRMPINNLPSVKTSLSLARMIAIPRSSLSSKLEVALCLLLSLLSWLTTGHVSYWWTKGNKDSMRFTVLSYAIERMFVWPLAAPNWINRKRLPTD